MPVKVTVVFYDIFTNFELKYRGKGKHRRGNPMNFFIFSLSLWKNKLNYLPQQCAG